MLKNTSGQHYGKQKNCFGKFFCQRLLTGLILVLFGVGIVSAGLVFVYAQSPEDRPPEFAKKPQMLDDLFSEIARRAPGFGGAYIEGDELVVYLLVPKPEQQAVAENAFSAVFGRERIPPGGVRVLQGQYDFRQLKTWHDWIGSLFDIPGVVFTDIDERTNRLAVGVESEDDFGAVKQELTRLGIPLAAVNLKITEPIVPMVTLQDKIRPLQAGTQIAFSGYLCTLGFNAIRVGLDGFVVNSHCTDKQGGVESTLHYQPTIAANNFIGTEIVDPVYTNALCPTGPGWGGKLCRWSDSAFSQRAEGIDGSLGVIARPDSVNTGSLIIVGTFAIVDTGPSLVGHTVNKVGRTTAWTQGSVSDTCVNTGVSGTRIVQLCQDWVSAGVAGGDSGSPTFSIISGNDVELRGILWGGTTSGTTFVYSPIANVQFDTELGPLTTYPAVAITLETDGSVDFGILPLGSIQDTTSSGINDVETVRIDKGPANLDVKSTVFSDGTYNWNLGASNGSNQVKWEFSPDTSTWNTFLAANTLYDLANNVPQSETRNLYLRLTMPTSTASSAQYSSTVTIVATAP